MSAPRTGLWFIAVGTAAALTHMGVFALTRSHLWPEVANATGFVVAFFVSFAGHRWLSFQDAQTGLLQSLRRFAVTALAGFAGGTGLGDGHVESGQAGWPARQGAAGGGRGRGFSFVG